MDLAFFDRTARGRLIITGRDRKDLLHRLATAPLVDLREGQGRATCFCTHKGRLIDWTVVLDRGSDLLLLSANPERLSGHIQQYTITEDVTVRNYMAIEIVVCGPGAAGFLGLALEPWGFATLQFAGVQMQVVRIEPLLGDAYAVLAPDAVGLRRMLSERGQALGPGEVEALRVQGGIPAFPSEINEDRNPWEAGLGAYVSLAKGCYVGQEVIARLHNYDRVQQRLVGLRVDVPASAPAPLHLDGREVGMITTATGSRALGFVDKESAHPGTRLDGATVVALPMD